MPIYEYECPICREVLELWRSIYETEKAKCPQCSFEMNKRISRSSFQLKGDGWYADGYCKKSKSMGRDKKTSDSTGCSSSNNKEANTCQACHN